MGIRVLLADDHRLVREGLRALLDGQSGIDVVAEAGDGQEAFELAQKVKPDVVVMDIAMPVMNGIDATRKIAAELPEIRIVVLSMHGHRQVVMEALCAGASGYILKDCAQEDLVQAIRTVDANLTFLSPDIASSILEEYTRTRAEQQAEPEEHLTKREQQVCRQLAEGKKTSEIARELSVSVRTVEDYRRIIMRKLELSGAAALTQYAIRTGLTSIDS